MPDLHLKRVDEREIDTILAEDIDFSGELTFTEPLMIKGRFHGQIKSQGELYIGAEARVEADIKAPLLSIRGALKGEMSCSRRVELYSSAEVSGNMISPEVIMEAGAKFNGNMVMGEDNE
ncbi:bactofilin family protein [Spirochaeta cellobiosiphila]|uniref:bactofilin family protein n=1 Tax=Spirochaeta cellobiosiphila TaxID=504483 RepID=UPI0004228281|nr:polymer-forming cytoskeletal protein [Spirochaeta cellobiosiphila]